MPTLEWRIAQQGAEQVRAELQRLTEQFEKGEISAEQFQDRIKTLNKDLNAHSAAARLAERSYRVQHQGLVNLSRIMNSVNAVMRSVVAAQQLWTLGSILQAEKSQQLADAEDRVREAQRELNNLLSDPNADPVKVAEAQEKLNAALEEYNRVMGDEKNGAIEKAFNFAAGLGLIVSSAGSVLSKLPQLKASFDEMAGKLGGLRTLFGSKLPAPDVSGPQGALRNLRTSIIATDVAGTNWKTNLLKMAGFAAGLTFGLHGLTREANDLTDSLMRSAQTIGGFALLGGALGGPIGAGIGAAVGGVLDVLHLLAERQEMDKNFQKEWEKTFGSLREGPSIEELKSRTNPFARGTGPSASATTTAARVSPEELALRALAAQITDEELNRFINTLENGLPQAGEKALAYLNETLKPALAEAWTGIWNNVITLTNVILTNLVAGVQDAMNQVIAAMNKAISAYNKAAAKLGKPKIEKLSPVSLSFTPIATVGSGTNALGAGPAEIASTAAAASQNTFININVAGSVVTQRQLTQTISDAQKNDLIRRQAHII